MFSGASFKWYIQNEVIHDANLSIKWVAKNPVWRIAPRMLLRDTLSEVIKTLHKIGAVNISDTHSGSGSDGVLLRFVSHTHGPDSNTFGMCTSDGCIYLIPPHITLHRFQHFN